MFLTSPGPPCSIFCTRRPASSFWALTPVRKTPAGLSGAACATFFFHIPADFCNLGRCQGFFGSESSPHRLAFLRHVFLITRNELDAGTASQGRDNCRQSEYSGSKSHGSFDTKATGSNLRSRRP